MLSGKSDEQTTKRRAETTVEASREEGEPMSEDIIRHEDERKTYVRNYVARKMEQLQKPRRSKNPAKEGINAAIRDVIVNTKQGRLHIVAEANFRWQKKQLREYLKNKDDAFSYRDMKEFIHTHGWDELWIPTRRLQGYWLSICRTGDI
jgi:hypothetical protein